MGRRMKVERRKRGNKLLLTSSKIISAVTKKAARLQIIKIFWGYWKVRCQTTRIFWGYWRVRGMIL
jgi:hypothetical protein